MASARVTSGRATTRLGSRTTSSSRSPVSEEIVPSSAWSEDSKGHYLLVDLPEFKKEDVKLHMDSYGRIIVKGERQTKERKRVHFNLTFPVPLDSDTDKVTGKFDRGILYVTVPKRIPQEHKENDEAEKPVNDNAVRAEEKEHQEHHSSDKKEQRDPSQHECHRDVEEMIHSRNQNAQIGEFSEGLIRKWEQEPMVRNAVSVLKKNRGIVVTAVVAFSLGFLVSRKF